MAAMNESSRYRMTVGSRQCIAPKGGKAGEGDKIMASTRNIACGSFLTMTSASVI